MKNAYFLVLISFLVLNSGCHISGSVSGISESESVPAPSIPILFDKAQGAEFVSSSIQHQESLVLGYRVQASVGGYQQDVYVQSGRGYYVFSSVQGILVSKAGE